MTIYIKILIVSYVVSGLVFIGTFKNMSQNGFKKSTGLWFPATILCGLGALIYFFYLVISNKL